jgi:hypothetical protein
VPIAVPVPALEPSGPKVVFYGKPVCHQVTGQRPKEECVDGDGVCCDLCAFLLHVDHCVASVGASGTAGTTLTGLLGMLLPVWQCVHTTGRTGCCLLHAWHVAVVSMFQHERIVAPDTYYCAKYCYASCRL